jgi:glutamate racemase
LSKESVDTKPLQPIGIFDSGIGGLTVLRAIHQLMPDQPLIYLADQAHVPYGPRPLQEVRHFSEGITRYLLEQGSRLIVVACNTASAAALKYLRQVFPDTPFVGMEPAVKPAAEYTRSGVVGVLATPATFQGELYASVVERFGQGVKLMQHTCPGLVAQIENGALESKETERILEDALQPMLEQGIDTIVLGCTHYPFVIPLIQRITGPNVRVIDPAPAVARQVQRLLVASSLFDLETPTPKEGLKKSMHLLHFFTTGDPSRLEDMLPTLVGEKYPVEGLIWNAGEIVD